MKPDAVRDTVRAALSPAVGKCLLLAVSGGADSMTLLHIVLSLAEELSLTVGVAHVNHGLRGEESRRDEDFVAEQCGAAGVPVYICRVDVGAMAAQQHRGVEETGRDVRYSVFGQIADAHKYDFIVTAHTASDNVETLLLHICRGSGLHGLCGISPQNGRLLRPLLGVDRSEIAAYCAAHGVTYVQDSTNADITYSRNRLRAQALPAMEAINPRVGEAVLRLTEAVRRDDETLQILAQQLADSCGDAIAPLAEALPAVRVRALYLLAVRAGADVGSVHLRALERLLAAGGSLSLPGGVTAVCSQGKLLWYTDRSETESCLPIAVGESVCFAGRRLVLRCIDGEDCKRIVKKQQKVFQNAVSCDRIAGRLSLRSRRNGDALHPSGRGVGKSLHKLFAEMHIPAGERDAVPLLCDEQGILLVYGICCDERVKPDETCDKCLVLYEE